MKDESKVRGIRFPIPLLEKAEDVCKRNNTNVNKKVIELLKEWLGVK
jgi:ATP-dependent protease HslVU (ClpYQ) peptidase subunit